MRKILFIGIAGTNNEKYSETFIKLIDKIENTLPNSGLHTINYLNAENYYYNIIHEEISNKMIFDMLNKI